MLYCIIRIHLPGRVFDPEMWNVTTPQARKTVAKCLSFTRSYLEIIRLLSCTIELGATNLDRRSGLLITLFVHAAAALFVQLESRLNCAKEGVIYFIDEIGVALNGGYDANDIYQASI